MSSIIIKLKRTSQHEWALFAPKGHQLGPKFRGDEYKAIEWAKAWISGFHNWILELDKEKDNG